MDMRNKISQSAHSIILSIMLSLLAIQPINSFAEQVNNIAVVYPKIREPYLSIFEEIKAGIDQSLPKPAKAIIIDQQTTASTLGARLDEANITSIITLGNGAYRLSEKLAEERVIIGGAVLTRPEDNQKGAPSISMIVSPKLQFLQLKEIAPNINTIHVIYNPEKDDWLIQRAATALKGTATVLNAIPADGLKKTARAYQKLLSEDQLKSTDALWLLQGDKVSGESTVLSQILQKAWEQSFVVFSANPSHVKRGALFATYPNNIKLGERLGNAIINTQINMPSYVQPLQDLKVAFNARTAEHLKLNINRSKQQSFDLIFPRR